MQTEAEIESERGTKGESDGERGGAVIEMGNIRQLLTNYRNKMR